MSRRPARARRRRRSTTPARCGRFFLQFENPAWEKELEAFYRTDVDVPATLTVDGRTYRDVGVRFRGMSSYMMTPEGSKRSLNVTVDFAREDQRLMGYRTLNLLNVNGDATFARPLLYSEIAQKYLPAAKANYVRVVINNEDWGVYVNVEQFNTDFIQARFGTQARRALEGARQSLRPGRHGLPGRRRGEVQVHLRDQVERQRRARGGISSPCSRC